MIFIKRQIDSLLAAGVVGRTFCLSGRTNPLTLLRECIRLRAALREFRPHIVHAQYGTITALVAAICARTPLVITYRGSDLNVNLHKSRLRCVTGRLFSQIAAIRARRIILVSEQLVGTLWWKRHLVTVIPSGIDSQTFSPRPKAHARERLRWDITEPIVLFNGTDRAIKRPDLARAAVAEASAICGKVRLVELDGSQPAKLVAEMMNASDCLVLTSDHEGSPNVVKEAMAVGLPVVSRDVGDVRQRLTGVEPSRIVGATAAELGQAIADIIAIGERSNGPEASQTLSLEAIAARILAVYRSALGHSMETTSGPSPTTVLTEPHGRK